jgi:internalin A
MVSLSIGFAPLVTKRIDKYKRRQSIMIFHLLTSANSTFVSIMRVSIMRYCAVCCLGYFFSTMCLVSAEADDNKKTIPNSSLQFSGLFADPHLQQCIENTAAANHWTQIEQISGRIDCRKHSISNLSGMEALTNVTSLDLSVNYISDITPLSKLQALETLKLSFNTVADLRPLETLTQLKILNMDNNMVSNITALKHLYRLTNLSLQNNLVTNISPLEGLTALQYLNLAVNTISDISALAHLDHLRYLSLLNNEVADISVLENLTSLQGLHLGGNKIRSADSVTNLISLSNLNLSNNGLNARHSPSIEALASLPAILHVDLSSNEHLSCTTLNHLISELNTLSTIVAPAVARDGETCSYP